VTDVVLKESVYWVGAITKLQNHVVMRKMFMYSEVSEEKRKNNGEVDEH